MDATQQTSPEPVSRMSVETTHETYAGQQTCSLQVSRIEAYGADNFSF
ncbi:MAG: hypothetical protein WB511_13575 [Nitrososphaeraceae archaeon]